MGFITKEIFIQVDSTVIISVT